MDKNNKDKKSKFVERVFERLPEKLLSDYYFQHWHREKRSTDEAFGILQIPHVNTKKLTERIMDVDHYSGNIDHVVECRLVEDSRFATKKEIRCYQKVKIPLLGFIQQEIAIINAGKTKDYQVIYWYLLEEETQNLDPKKGIRNQYDDGAWLIGEHAVGYALSTAPVRKDVGFLKWKALTTGSDLGASKLVKDNIRNMVSWSEKL